MKLVQINSVCGFGSTGGIVRDISEVLSTRGIENWVLYGVGQSDYSRGIKFGGDLNLRSHQIKTRLLGKHGFYSKVATRNLVNILDLMDPDVVHLHNLHGHYLNVEILFDYLKRRGKRVIWTLHDCWSFTGHCAHFDYVGCEKWKTACHTCPQLREYPGSLVFDRSKSSYKDKSRIFRGIEDMTLVTPSRWLEGLVEESFLRDYPVETIYNGVDMETFSYRKSDARERYGIGDRTMILAVANFWTERKGYSSYLELARHLADDEVLVLVGKTTFVGEELPPNMIQLSRTETVEELVELYSTADLFLNLTLEEVFGLVNIEALACQTPVITFDTGGSPETVDADTGRVVERGDIEGILKMVRDLKSSKISLDGDTCRRRVEDNFSRQTMIERYMDLY